MTSSRSSYADPDLCGWDPMHQRLLDAGLKYRAEMEKCRADKTALARKLEVRTSTAARVYVPYVKRRTDWRDIAASLSLGLLGGFMLSKAVK